MPYRRYGEYGEVEEPYYEEPSWGYAYAEPSGMGYAPTVTEPPLLPTTIPERPFTAHAGMPSWEQLPRPTAEQPTGLGTRGFFIPSAAPTGGRVPGPAYPTLPYVPMAAPTMPEMPTLELPEREPERIESLAQRIAGPGLREARRRVREISGKYFENPNVKRMTLREAMAGYGMGLERIMGGARREAAAEYEAEYRPLLQKSLAEYQARTSALMAQYQAAWREYMARMQTMPQGAY